MQQLPALVVVIPLCAALLSMAFTLISPKLSRAIVFTALLCSLAASILLLRETIAQGTIHYAFGGYAMPYGI